MYLWLPKTNGKEEYICTLNYSHPDNVYQANGPDDYTLKGNETKTFPMTKNEDIKMHFKIYAQENGKKIAPPAVQITIWKLWGDERT